MIQQLINDERFTNVQRAQAGLTKLFQKASKSGTFYRVLKNDEPLGVLIPNSTWESLTEDFEALSSPGYLRQIAAARREKGGISLEELKKKLGLKP
ncbi:MAG: hypothetical protein AAB973_00410 [Patescibacteria group bacterium]